MSKGKDVKISKKDDLLYDYNLNATNTEQDLRNI